MRRIVALLVVVMLCAWAGAAHAKKVKIYNQTSETMDIYFRALGCAGVENSVSFVCKRDDVASGGSVEYEYPDGTSAPTFLPDCAGPFDDLDHVFSTGVAADGDHYIDEGCIIRPGKPPAPRADRRATVTVGEGHYGTWRRGSDCPPNTFANQYRVRIEKPQGKGDDTALNSVELRCGFDTAVSSSRGYWGRWSDWASCPIGEYLTGAQLKVEPKQGKGKDDTGANDVDFACSGGSAPVWPLKSVGGRWVSVRPEGGPWGAWGPDVSCPVGQVVCGVQLRVEVPQTAVFDAAKASVANGDDTAMNGLRLRCCSAPPAPSRALLTVRLENGDRDTLCGSREHARVNAWYGSYSANEKPRLQGTFWSDANGLIAQLSNEGLKHVTVFSDGMETIDADYDGKAGLLSFKPKCVPRSAQDAQAIAARKFTGSVAAEDAHGSPDPDRDPLDPAAASELAAFARRLSGAVGGGGDACAKMAAAIAGVPDSGKAALKLVMRRERSMPPDTRAALLKLKSALGACATDKAVIGALWRFSE